MEKLIEITGGGYAAKINLSKGANCISLTHENYGARILREPDRQKGIDNPYLYGMPILFPANRISGGGFEFEGRSYRFPINEPATGCHLHGLLHTTAFEAEQTGESEVKCVFDQPYLDFPHRFRMEISYSLSDRGFKQVTEITNLSEENMPVLLGFHTTFNVCFLKSTRPQDVRVFTEVSDLIERNMSTYLPTGRILPADSITNDLKAGTFSMGEGSLSRHYRADGRGRIELLDTARQIKVVYENDEKFKWRLFYSGDMGEYICLEPMNCLANCPNAPFDRNYGGFDYIAPHASKQYVSKLHLQEVSP